MNKIKNCDGICKQKILFVCKHNVYRSKIAEFYLKKINTEVNVSSGGLFAPGGIPNPIQKKIFKKLKIKLPEPRPISLTTLTECNIIVIVADDIPVSLFEDEERYGKKEIICWEIPDLASNQKEIEETIRIIKEKVEKLNHYLKRS